MSAKTFIETRFFISAGGLRCPGACFGTSDNAKSSSRAPAGVTGNASAAYLTSVGVFGKRSRPFAAGLLQVIKVRSLSRAPAGMSANAPVPSPATAGTSDYPYRRFRSAARRYTKQRRTFATGASHPGSSEVRRSRRSNSADSVKNPARTIPTRAASLVARSGNPLKTLDLQAWRFRPLAKRIRGKGCRWSAKQSLS